MRKLIATVALFALAMFVFVGTSSAAPAPKTTGGVGYTIGSDVQRQFSFSSIQSTTDTCSTFLNVAGITSFDFQLNGDPSNGHYVHDAALTQNGQSVGGTGDYAPGQSWANTWHITSGSVVGNTLDLTWVYDTGTADVVGVTHHMTGTIAANGGITGSWSDNYVQGGSPAPNTTRTGTFTATGATSIVNYCGKGNAYYSDASGLWYVVNVKAVSVVGDYAWFAGPVVAGNVGAGQWLFVKVYDGGQPG